jgi:hypothetical protein
MNSSAFDIITSNPTPFIIAGVIFLVAVAAGFFIYRHRKNKFKPLSKDKVADLTAKTQASEAANKTDGISKSKEGEKAPTLEGEKLDVGPQCKYKAVIRWLPKTGRTPVIEFGNRISQPLGDLIYCEPSCPTTGEAYYIKENMDGSFSPCDPRSSILSEETPYTAWDATHWPEAEGVWIFKKSWLAQVSTVLMYVCIGAVILIALVKLGG